MILHRTFPAHRSAAGAPHTIPGYETAVGASGDPETESLRGSGSGATFTPNPDGWRQMAVSGGFTTFIRPLQPGAVAP